MRWPCRFRRYRKFPSPTTAVQQAVVGTLVETILTTRANATADTAAAEATADALVAALYGLTPAEAAHFARPTAGA